ncbi:MULTISPECIES: hydrolase [unclassified Beijerinckia]|uniref:hydrolase n=1 Tax=unclassified Beijerinckia TaxID=2638183 RepID=UPI00089559AD|nr:MULTISPECIES: hydrolase [unclassified Beijerinckia]MDH7796363.1 nicotinamidase-related amidase [Beijerinckia sp. GAS462]SEC41935.1 Isochorismate hydrolase [Beijerinckia sp. 28-YEA-48]
MLLDRHQSQLLIVDIQERLLPAMVAPDSLIANVQRLCVGARELAVPITVSEQYPKGIGATVTSVREAAGDGALVLDKLHFSCARDDKIAMRINELGQVHQRKQLVVCGIESHVCVLQSAIDFQTRGYQVAVIADAVSSRSDSSKATALERLRQSGVTVVTTEMVLFEWLEVAGTDQFRTVSKLIK